MGTNYTNRNRKSFTLIELLVVLALVAILSVVVILTLNPAELLKQARDSNRLSDLSTINTALNLFSADVTSGFTGTSTVVYVSIPDNASSTCGSLGLPTLPTGYTYNCVTAVNLRNTNGTGWIPVNFQRISSNSPVSQLPIDPINTTSSGNYYTYISGGSWELASNLESAKQKSLTGASGTDGGVSFSSYEIGNNLRLIPSGLLEWKRDLSLVGYWPLDEGAGAIAYDYSGYGNNGTWNGTGSHWTSGRFGSGAASFNGTNDYVNVPDSLSLDISRAFTVSLWLNITSGSNRSIISKSSMYYANPIDSYLSGCDASIYFYTGHGGTGYDSSPITYSYPCGVWKYVSVTFDGSNVVGYVNGLQTMAPLAIIQSVQNSSNPLQLGSRSSADIFLYGTEDDIRVYNRALSATEVLALYNATK